MSGVFLNIFPVYYLWKNVHQNTDFIKKKTPFSLVVRDVAHAWFRLKFISSENKMILQDFGMDFYLEYLTNGSATL